MFTLLLQFWKPIAIGLALFGLIFAAVVWDNNRLQAQYDRGVKETEEKFQRESEIITDRYEGLIRAQAQTLVETLAKNKEAQNLIGTQVETYVKTHVFECSPDPEYLRLWDYITNQGGDPTEGARGSKTEVSGQAPEAQR